MKVIRFGELRCLGCLNKLGSLRHPGDRMVTRSVLKSARHLCDPIEQSLRAVGSQLSESPWLKSTRA
jgi:hypothetical protein